MQIPITYTRKLIHETVYLLLLIPLIGHAEEATLALLQMCLYPAFLAQKLVN